MPDWYPLSFDSTGTPLFPDQIDGPDGIASALTGQPDNPVTDLWILSYGWNTSVEGGDAFYKIWVDLLRSQIQQSNPPNAYPMFIGVYWPSEILADTNNKPNPAPATATRENFIQAYRPIFDPERKQDDAVFAQDFGGVYDFIAAPDLTNQQQVSAFLATLKKYQQEDPHADQPVVDNVIDTGADALATMLTTGINTIFPKAVGNGLLDFLRVFSFWTMKGRAGTVGANGLAPFIASFRASAAQNNPALRIHLMGHSFGAKLLTSAVFETASFPDAPQPVVDTLILLQGAFSQFSFTSNIPQHQNLTGFYANVITQGMVTTPVTVIYSLKDLANAILYPIGMAPVLEQAVVAIPPVDLTQYYKSDEFRGSIGANGVQGFEDAQMFLAKLPWPGIDQNTLNTISCINVNRTPFFDPKLNDPLIGIHNDYQEPDIFQAAVAISQLTPGNV
nr:hypothetical protein [Ktedonobacteraceae bacterium]